jgi:hypothetical protein
MQMNYTNTTYTYTRDIHAHLHKWKHTCRDVGVEVGDKGDTLSSSKHLYWQTFKNNLNFKIMGAKKKKLFKGIVWSQITFSFSPLISPFRKLATTPPNFRFMPMALSVYRTCACMRSRHRQKHIPIYMYAQVKGTLICFICTDS